MAAAPTTPAQPDAGFALKPGHRWFAHRCREAEDGWMGPHPTFEAAVADVITHDHDYEPGASIFVTSGRKLLKHEREEMGVEYMWECATDRAFKVFPPARKAS